MPRDQDAGRGSSTAAERRSDAGATAATGSEPAGVRPAIQLYSLREIDESLPAILRRVAAAGFEGVEFADRIHDADTAAVAAALAETGLEPVGAHVSFSALEDGDAALLDQYEAVGYPRLVVPHVSPSSTRTARRLDELAARLERTAERLDGAGFDVSYHNQFQDFARPIESRVLSWVVDADALPIAGEYGVELAYNGLKNAVRSPSIEGTKFGRLVAETDPSLVSFEVDLGWVAAAGYDSDTMLDALDRTAWSLHLNDVAPDDEGNYASTEPGSGIVDFEAAAAAARRHGVDWLVYEHDDPEDPVATIEHGADAVLPLTGGN